MGKRVSIVDVAKRAGVSVSTVSLVMNNRPNVAAETAEAVWKASKELGYTPGGDGKKRGPKPGPRHGSQAKQVALLMTGYPAGCLQGLLCSRVLYAAEAALARNGVGLLLHQDEDENEAQSFLQKQHADAILLLGRASGEKLSRFLRRHACVQILGEGPSHGEFDHVSYDNRTVARLAAEHLLRGGHSVCAYLGSRHETIYRERQHEFSFCLSEGNATLEMLVDDAPVQDDRPTAALLREPVVSLAKRFLSLNPRPTAVFAQTAQWLAVFQSALYQLGAVAADIPAAVTTDRDPLYLEALYPKPAVIDIHPDEIGRQSVDQVLWRLKHRNEPRVRRLITPSLETPE